MRATHARVFAIRFAALILLASMIAACGGDDKKESSTNQAAGTAASGATQQAAGTTTRIGGSVSVLATWGGDEQDSFLAMVKPFEERTGVKVEYEGTRDLNAVLTTRVRGGNPPDVAGLPGPGQMAEFARDGKLIDLGPILNQSTLKAQYSDEWLKLAQVDGKQVGIFIKAALKGPIWYNPQALNKFTNGTAPKTWDELMTLSQRIADSGTTPWCIGFGSGAASGWPGTDWLEDIVLRQAGPDVYDQWAQGKIKWSSPEIKKAWETWGKVVGNDKMVYGGKQAMLATEFGESGNPMFADPPKCYLHHQGSFITDFFVKANPKLKPVQDFSFFPFPDIDQKYSGAQEVAGDLFGMFKDTPQSRALLAYLTTPEAQAIWAKRGGAISPNKQVAFDTYPDQIAKEMAATLTSAKSVRFDASDQMPEAMNNAFFKAILDFVQNPGSLDNILANLDRVQSESYKK